MKRSGLLVFYLSLILAASCFAQQSRSVDNKSDEISALRREVSELAERQQEVLDRLDELKQLLAANGAVRLAPQPPVPPSELTVRNQGFRGDSAAAVAIIEYADFECPYCGEYEHDIYPQIAENYIQTGKVKYYFRDLPLPMHPHALGAARAARCAGEQGKYWEMHDSLFAKQKMLRDIDMPERAKNIGLDTSTFSECLGSDRYTDEIKQGVAEAEKFGIDGTPTFLSAESIRMARSQT